MSNARALKNLADVPSCRASLAPMDAREAAYAAIACAPTMLVDPSPVLCAEQARAFVLGIIFASKNFVHCAEFCGMTVSRRAEQGEGDGGGGWGRFCFAPFLPRPLPKKHADTTTT